MGITRVPGFLFFYWLMPRFGVHQSLYWKSVKLRDSRHCHEIIGKPQGLGGRLLVRAGAEVLKFASYLSGGFKYVLFSALAAEMIQID